MAPFLPATPTGPVTVTERTITRDGAITYERSGTIDLQRADKRFRLFSASGSGIGRARYTTAVVVRYLDENGRETYRTVRRRGRLVEGYTPIQKVFDRREVPGYLSEFGIAISDLQSSFVQGAPLGAFFPDAEVEVRERETVYRIPVETLTAFFAEQRATGERATFDKMTTEILNHLARLQAKNTAIGNRPGIAIQIDAAIAALETAGIMNGGN